MGGGGRKGRRALRRLLSLLLLVSWAGPVALATPAPWTPETLLARVERRWPGLEAARQAVTAAEARLSEARYAPYLRARVQAGLSMAPEQRGTVLTSPDSQLPLTNPWQPVAAVRASGAVPLYTFGKLEAAVEAGEAGVQAAEALERRARQRLRHQVLRAYFGLQLALDAEALFGEAEGWLRRARRRLQRALEDEEDGVGPSDEHRLTLAAATLAARRAELRRMRHTAEAALAELLGDGSDAVRIADCPAEPVRLREASLEQWQRRAEAQRPELRALAAAVRAAGARRAATRAGAWPDLAVAWEAGISWAPGITDQRNPFVRDPANYQDLSAGLVLRWSLDPVGSHFRSRREAARWRQQRARLQEAVHGVRLEVAEAFEAWRAATGALEAWADGERTARRWVVSALQGYEVGTSSARELVDALKAYVEARWSRLRAVHDLNVAASRLLLAAGVDEGPQGGWQPPCEPLEDEGGE